MIKHFLAFCCVMLLAALSACASGKGGAAGQTPDPAQTDGPGGLRLPAPSELLKTPSNPPDDYERYRYGGSYDYASALYNRFFPTGVVSEYGLFSPQYSEPDNATLDKAAYCAYHFYNMSEYSGPSKVQTSWVTPPTDWANCYMALANFNADRWDWYGVSESGVVTLPEWGRYLSASSDAYVVLLLLGTDQAEVEWLVFGGSSIFLSSIGSDLNDDPAQNVAPLTVNFEALAFGFGGTITHYDWDFDNDGTPEVTGDETGLQPHVYTEPGVFVCKATAFADDGNSVSTELEFTVVDPFNAPPVADLTGDHSIGDAPLTVVLDAGGSTDDDTITSYEWDLDGDGEYEQTTTEPTVTYTFMRYGSTTVTVRVTDNDYATDTADFGVFLDTGWRKKVIDPSVSVIRRMSMAVQGSGLSSRTCVAYGDYQAGKIFFARATSDLGDMWGAPVEPLSTADHIFAPPVLTIKPGTDLPQIAFIARNAEFQDVLYFVEATNKEGTAWNTPVVVDGPGSFSDDMALTTSPGGTPAIAAISRVAGLEAVQYYLSATAGGTTWNAPVEVGDTGISSSLRGLGLLIADGLPLISLYGASNGQRTGCFSASAADGSAWDSFDQIGEISAAPRSLILVDGKPAIAAGLNSQDNLMYYIRADDSAGKSWTGAVTQLTDPGRGGEAAMAIVGGVPVVAFRDWSKNSLMYITAADSTGSTWNEPVVLDSATDMGEPVNIVSSNGFPVVCYSDHANHKLLAGYWL